MMDTAALSSDLPSIRYPATYDDVLAAPEHFIAEVIDGELFLQPRPAGPHAYTNSELVAILHARHSSSEKDSAKKWFFLYEPELHFGSDILVPDIAGWRPGRNPYDPSIPYFTSVPDWVCEVASPSTCRRDRMRKLPAYARAGVEYVWLVDPMLHSVEVFHRPPDMQGLTWVYAAGGINNEIPILPPFDDQPFSLADWWIETRFGQALTPEPGSPR